MEPEIAAFWDAFLQSTSLSPSVVPTVTSFGDSPDLQTRLAHLVVAGTKRVTTSLLQSYDDEPLPELGTFFVVIDGDGAPRCVCRIIRVEVRLFSEVDAAFAAEEGEGDLTLESWRKSHRAFFERQAAREGLVFDESMDVVLEQFHVVWPTSAFRT